MRILHIDDSPSDQLLVSEVLGPQFEVTPVPRLQDAYVLMRAGAPFDCLLLDLDLPGRRGIEATREWRIHGCDRIPMIALSGTSDPVTRALCMMAGSPCNSFFSKHDIDKSGRLQRAIMQAIDHQHKRLDRGVSGVYDVTTGELVGAG